MMNRIVSFLLMCLVNVCGFAQNEDVVVQDTLNHWLTYNVPGQTVVDSLGIPDLEGEFEYKEQFSISTKIKSSPSKWGISRNNL